MSLKIGVSGIRGIIGESLTEEVISNFAKAYGTFVCRGRSRPAPTILIGRDTRQSGEFARKVVIDGLLSTGCSITDVGLAPAPTVLFLARSLKSDGAIIITASHNPAQWNGLKFVRPDGTFLTKEEIKKLISIYDRKKFILPPNKKTDVGAIHELPLQNRLHLDAVVKAVDAVVIKKARFKVAVDYCNGTGAVTTSYLLKKLGCAVVAINTKPDGKFAHNPEPTAENLKQLCDFVKKTKADVGFAQDPDADRLAVVSEKGLAIGEENTLALAVKHVLSRPEGRWRAERSEASPKGTMESGAKRSLPEGDDGRITVVVNLSTSRMIDDICNEAGGRLYRCAVGETNVVDKMRHVDAVIGGEGNGGVIYPAVNFGRDSFIGMALVLEYMAKTGKGLSQLVADIKQYCIEKAKIDCPQEKIPLVFKKIEDKLRGTRESGACPRPPQAGRGGRSLPEGESGAKRSLPEGESGAKRSLPEGDEGRITILDGIKIDYPDGWVHVRGSNTEPVIRIMAEAETKEKATEYIDKILTVMK